MCRHAFTYIASLAVSVFLAAGQAGAQGPSPRPVSTQRPTVSPYLNLARPGTPALNYYNLVRPQVEFRNDVQRLRQDLASSQQTVAEVDAALALPGTGHATRFMDYSQYFLSRGGPATLGLSPRTAVPPRPGARALGVAPTPRGPGR